MNHGNGKAFSSKGVKIAVDYFLQQGHTNVIAIVPEVRNYPTLDLRFLNKLEKKKQLIYTPDKCYDDRFIIRTALHYNAVIVSNDKYRDLMKEDKEWEDYIKNNRVGFVFVDDFFQLPDDPMGRNGPKLQEVLSE
jgi:ribonuclease ZC3H12